MPPLSEEAKQLKDIARSLRTIVEELKKLNQNNEEKNVSEHH